jgi:beta-N-acetylhexosaminidase
MKKNILWMLAAILVCGLTLTSCSNYDEPSLPKDEVEAQLSKMTLREKVGQMFYVRMESLDTTIHWNTYTDLQENPLFNYLQGLKDAGVTGCIKHFPGHGDTKADTHYGYASTRASAEY